MRPGKVNLTDISTAVQGLNTTAKGHAECEHFRKWYFQLLGDMRCQQHPGKNKAIHITFGLDTGARVTYGNFQMRLFKLFHSHSSCATQ